MNVWTPQRRELSARGLRNCVVVGAEVCSGWVLIVRRTRPVDSLAAPINWGLGAARCDQWQRGWQAATEAASETGTTKVKRTAWNVGLH